jgi:hypothetical protein
MNPLSTPILLAVILVSAVPAFAKVKSKTDPNTDFSAFKTYAWVAGFEATRELADRFIKPSSIKRCSDAGYKCWKRKTRPTFGFNMSSASEA